MVKRRHLATISRKLLFACNVCDLRIVSFQEPLTSAAMVKKKKSRLALLILVLPPSAKLIVSTRHEFLTLHLPLVIIYLLVIFHISMPPWSPQKAFKVTCMKIILNIPEKITKQPSITPFKSQWDAGKYKC